MAKQDGSSKEVESLRLENEALRTRLATFSEFLGMVSHELRTPLTTIKGSTATVLSDPSVFDPAETRQFFRIIDEQADLLRDLINNLLDLTRSRGGGVVGRSRTNGCCVPGGGGEKRLHAWREHGTTSGSTLRPACRTSRRTNPVLPRC